MRTFLSIIFLTFCCSYLLFSENIIIDSKMTFEESIADTKAPESIVNNLELIDVEYYSFDRKLHKGQIVIHRSLVEDVRYIFDLIKEKKFPIAKVIPIVAYRWSDDKSMADNNTSGFNYRKVANKNKLSNHSYGFAIDFNPFQNPAVYSDGHSSPKGSDYDPQMPGTIDGSHFITLELKKRGWSWGGDWKSLKDYQHFEKIIK